MFLKIRVRKILDIVSAPVSRRLSPTKWDVELTGIHGVINKEESAMILRVTGQGLGINDIIKKWQKGI